MANLAPCRLPKTTSIRAVTNVRPTIEVVAHCRMQAPQWRYLTLREEVKNKETANLGDYLHPIVGISVYIGSLPQVSAGVNDPLVLGLMDRVRIVKGGSRR